MEGNRRRKHVIIHKGDRELFIRSEIDNRYLWLLNLLQQDFYEKVYKTDFEDTKDFDEKKINFILNVFPKYRDAIELQWFRSSSMIIEENGRCELCGKKHTKYMYEIKNRYNDNIMKVGSSCIDIFRGINTRLPKGMSMEQFTNQQKRRIEKLSRLEEFSRRFGNANDLIKAWNLEYEKLPLEVAYNIHLEITKIHIRAKEIYKNYLNKSLSKDSLKEFDEIILLRKNVMKRVSNIILRNSKNRFACPKRVGNWLIQSGKIGVLNVIRKNDGIITEDVVTEIYEEDFVLGFLDDFNKMLQMTRFSIRMVNNKLSARFIDNRKGLKLKFDLNISIFMKKFGGLLFRESGLIKEDEFFDCLSLTDDDINYLLIDELNGIIKNSNYYVKLINDNYYLVKINSKEYADKLSVMRFINFNKAKIILQGKKGTSDIINALNKVSSWEPIENIEKYDIGDISEKPNFR